MVEETQFENDFEEQPTNAAAPTELATDQPTDEQAAAATALEDVLPGEPTTEEPDTEEDEEVEDDDFFSESEVEDVAPVDPTKIVTIQTTSSRDKIVEVDGDRPLSMIEIIQKSGLQFAGDFECHLNGSKISLTDVVPGGSTVIIAGKVKGG